MKEYQEGWLFLNKSYYSPIEYLMIITRFVFESFGDLLKYLPGLRCLSINYLVESNYNKKDLSSTVMKHLEYVLLKVNSIHFDRLEDLTPSPSPSHTLKLTFLSVYRIRSKVCINSKLIEKLDIFEYVSNTNKIKNLTIDCCCTLENMQLFVNLFPKEEYLKTSMIREEIEQIIRHLFFLCISETPKIYLRKFTF